MSKNTIKELTATWYSKLKETGFIDIELPSGRLSEPIYRTKVRAFAEINTRTAYYRYASDFLFEYKFSSKKDEKIWQDFADGIPYRKTAQKYGWTNGYVQGRLEKIKKVFKLYLWIRSNEN